MRTQLAQVALLVRPTPLETGYEVAQQLQALIESAPHVVDRRRDLHDALGAQSADSKGTMTKSLAHRAVKDVSERRGGQSKDDQVVPFPQFVHGFDERPMQVRLRPGPLVGQVESYHGRTGGDDVDRWILRTPDMRLSLFERLMGLDRQLQAEAGPGEFGSQGVELGA